MPGFFHSVLRVLIHLGFLGPFLMGIFDSSFLFLPFGNDLLVVAMTARHHHMYLIYVLSAACGSTVGTFFIDLVARGMGEAGVTKIAGERKFRALKKKIGEHGGKALAAAALAPPPFPFTMVVAANSALGYPRRRLLTVGIARGVRFLILGGLAIKFGHAITAIIGSQGFEYFMYVLIAICVLGSAYSIATWLRKGRSSYGGGSQKQPSGA